MRLYIPKSPYVTATASLILVIAVILVFVYMAYNR
jgi:hypothetical protein